MPSSEQSTSQHSLVLISPQPTFRSMCEQLSKVFIEQSEVWKVLVQSNVMMKKGYTKPNTTVLGKQDVRNQNTVVSKVGLTSEQISTVLFWLRPPRPVLGSLMGEGHYFPRLLKYGLHGLQWLVLQNCYLVTISSCLYL